VSEVNKQEITRKNFVEIKSFCHFDFELEGTCMITYEHTWGGENYFLFVLSYYFQSKINQTNIQNIPLRMRAPKQNDLNFLFVK
jgi:hypothetical protein